MKLKYTGYNDQIKLYGIVFKNDETADVPNDLVAGSVKLKGERVTIMAVDKLKNNPEFEEVSEESEITRNEIMAQLSEKNIQFNKNSNKDVLLGLLNGNDDGG